LFFEWSHFVQAEPSARVILSLGSLTLFASTLAFLMYVFVLARIGMVRSNLFANLIPVFAALFSWFWLDEHFDSRKLAGIFLALLGVTIAQSQKFRIKPSETSSMP
jgi:drug/metabolite transporter (DMT)-like permease